MSYLNRRQFLLQSSVAAALLCTIKSRALAEALDITGLKDHFAGNFHVGTAISGDLMDKFEPSYEKLLAREFNAITMENDMKWERIHPKSHKWDWTLPDKFVNFGEQNDMYTIGHVLVWHSQTPDWVFENWFGRTLSRDALLNRMQDHISTVVGRYKGRVKAWDVVNEAVDEDKGWRKSPWLNIIGPDFLEHAFHYAHEADPKAHLIYNDYNMHSPEKRAFVAEFAQDYLKRGIPINGIGMQGHVGLGYPDIAEFEKSIVAFAKVGLKVHITELDLDVLPVAWEHTGAEISDSFAYSAELNPYAQGLPKNVERDLTDRYVAFFKLFIKYKDDIERVTFWGTSDKESWKNDFPVKGRTNYPLIFDRNYKRKPAYYAIADLTR